MTAPPALLSPPPAAMPTHSGNQRGGGLRALWGAVVIQAADDVRDEHVDSVIFAEAVAFFIGRGPWLESRTAVGDQLEMHPDDLERYGRRVINQRLLAEGRPPLAPKFIPPKARPAKTRQAPAGPPPPLPKLVAVFRPEPEHIPRRGGWVRVKRAYNPFDPHRELPSEVRAKSRAA